MLDMGTKMDVKELEIYKKIDDILWFDWHPIGVNKVPEVRDEYQSYVPIIYSLKKSSAGLEAIAQKLYKLETDTMGMSGTIERCREIAKKIENV